MKNSIIALLIALITAMGFSVFKADGMQIVTDVETYVFRNGASYYHFFHADGDKESLIKDLQDIVVILQNG